MERITAHYCFLSCSIIILFKYTVCLKTLNQVFKACFVLLTIISPIVPILLYNGRDDFIHLRKIVMQINMLKSARNTSPTVDLIFREIFINVVRNILMRYKHQVHLLIATTIALFCKVL